MFSSLEAYFSNRVDFSPNELDYFTSHLKIQEYPKHSKILEIGEVERNLRFIDAGITREYIEKSDEEFTFDICLEHCFSTSYSSFCDQSASSIGISCLTEVRCFEMDYNILNQMYEHSKNGEKMGRLAAEQMFTLAEAKLINILSKPALDHFQQLLNSEPHLFLKVPQKYIAEYLGMSPELLSRLKHQVV